MIDQAAFDQFIFDGLRGRDELVALIENGPGDYGPGIYPEYIPQEAALKAIVYDFLPSIDVNPQGLETQLSDAIALVRCLAKGSAYPWDVAEQIDLALNGRSAVIGGHRIHCERVSPFRLASPKGGAQWRFAGGRYLLRSSHPLT